MVDKQEVWMRVFKACGMSIMICDMAHPSFPICNGIVGVLENPVAENAKGF
jgi:hypothetical protein